MMSDEGYISSVEFIFYIVPISLNIYVLLVLIGDQP